MQPIIFCDKYKIPSSTLISLNIIMCHRLTINDHIIEILPLGIIYRLSWDIYTLYDNITSVRRVL